MAEEDAIPSDTNVELANSRRAFIARLSKVGFVSALTFSIRPAFAMGRPSTFDDTGCGTPAGGTGGGFRADVKCGSVVTGIEGTRHTVDVACGKQRPLDRSGADPNFWHDNGCNKLATEGTFYYWDGQCGLGQMSQSPYPWEDTDCGQIKTIGMPHTSSDKACGMKAKGGGNSYRGDNDCNKPDPSGGNWSDNKNQPPTTGGEACRAPGTDNPVR